MPKKKLLLHTCCAPCLTYPLAELKAQGYDVSIFYYGPNIHPRKEYEIRLQEAKKYVDDETEIIEGDYDDQHWFELTRGHENDPERGERCRICYEMRLAKTAEVAANLGFQYFTTTLSISPHKNADWLNEIGKKLEKKFRGLDSVNKKNELEKNASQVVEVSTNLKPLSHPLKYLEANWKKCDGFKKSLELSTKYQLKRQDYCGCVYSKRSPP